ncbi:divalent-cation tolerance protein CutA [bacterium BMS3Abin05]|nr:divalent-cation tolerance protein CutA [bacterium BMS3Abin05]GBE27617.1 divalent-cation tolerance protein CutA [bacterium BMS3Bbin03]HDK35418.1 divalent-cation tolerance protein CutA [Bacteroidota bacterium]HDL78716.1 divalent-cation tolerance protein CutA [Bacteroidota bacterium]HDZ10917.1 divalent-cation tolerance protein CutA [Bacteroidota bacterium]
MAEPLIVYVTVPSKKDGERIAHRLVETHLAACVNIIPHVESIYRWKGRIQMEGEFLLIIKTVRSQLNDLIKKIEKLHSYEVPEIVALPIVGGSARYLNWLDDETRPEGEK